MIIGIDRETLPRIKNPTFSSYASVYVKIYEDFMAQLRQTGIEIDPQSYEKGTSERIERLRQKGAIHRNDDKSIYINRISPACVACQTGSGSITFFISLQCHRNCFYCFNPNQENYEYYSRNKRDCLQELGYIHANGLEVKHLALTGGEPLLHKKDAVEFFKYADARFPSAYKRLYTCGDHINEAMLQELENAHLDEIRFSIRIQDLEKGHRHTYDGIALAKEYIPNVMVEMPVLPDTLEIMKEVLLELERLKIFSINLLELCYPLVNAEIFNQKSYKVKNPPHRVLYDYWYAGGVPVSRSELECLDLLEFAIDEKLEIGVHYCSLENKHTGQIYQQNLNGETPQTFHFSQKDYFLKSAKVFGEDISKVLTVFKKVKRAQYVINQEHNYMEFHVRNIKALQDLDIEVGISTSVLESREDGRYLRELKVDLTYPQIFDLATDV
jgi:pyruvate formate-lyase activating enzyme-like uncharacterized protein